MSGVTEYLAGLDPAEVKEMGAKALNQLQKESGLTIDDWPTLSVPEKQVAVAEAVVEAKKEAGAEDAAKETPVEELPAEPKKTAAKPKKAKKTAKAKKAAPEEEAAKGGAVVPSDVVYGEIMGPDLVTKTEKMVHSLDEEQAYAAVGLLMNAADYNQFRLGGVLTRMNEEGWFGGHEGFKQYVESLGFRYRKAAYLMNIYKRVVGNNLPYDKIAHVGWTKLKDLVEVLTEDNWQKWIEFAEGHNVAEVKAEIRSFLGKEPTPSKEKTFKLESETQKPLVQEALDKAMAQIGTDSEAAALEAICQEFVSGAAPEGTIVLKGDEQVAGFIMTFFKKMAEKGKDGFIEVATMIEGAFGVELEVIKAPESWAEEDN